MLHEIIIVVLCTIGDNRQYYRYVPRPKSHTLPGVSKLLCNVLDVASCYLICFRLMAATVATVDQLQTQTRARLQYVLKKRKVSISTIMLYGTVLQVFCEKSSNMQVCSLVLKFNIG